MSWSTPLALLSYSFKFCVMESPFIGSVYCHACGGESCRMQPCISFLLGLLAPKDLSAQRDSWGSGLGRTLRSTWTSSVNMLQV